MQQIDSMHQWRVGVLDSIDSAVSRGLADEDALLAVVERVIELGIWDAWYVNAIPAARLLIEASGRNVTEPLMRTIDELTNKQFTSWSEPKTESIRSFAEEAAWAIVEAQLDQRAHEG